MICIKNGVAEIKDVRIPELIVEYAVLTIAVKEAMKKRGESRAEIETSMDTAYRFGMNSIPEDAARLYKTLDVIDALMRRK